MPQQGKLSSTAKPSNCEHPSLHGEYKGRCVIVVTVSRGEVLKVGNCSCSALLLQLVSFGRMTPYTMLTVSDCCASSLHGPMLFE